MNSLTASVPTYKLQRHRFIGTFKRDKLGKANDADRRIIAAGGALARGGNAVDAQLYQGAGRRPYGAFEKMYGFPPEWVQMTGEQPLPFSTI